MFVVVVFVCERGGGGGGGGEVTYLNDRWGEGGGGQARQTNTHTAFLNQRSKIYFQVQTNKILQYN